MSECLGKLVQRQAAVEICPLSVLQPELAPDLCPTLRSGQHVAKQHTKKKKQRGRLREQTEEDGLLDSQPPIVFAVFWPQCPQSPGYITHSPADDLGAFSDSRRSTCSICHI